MDTTHAWYRFLPTWNSDRLKDLTSGPWLVPWAGSYGDYFHRLPLVVTMRRLITYEYSKMA